MLALFRLTIIQVPTSVLSTKTGTVLIPYRYNVGNLTNFTITMRLLIQDPGSLVQNLHGGSQCIFRTTVKSLFVKSLLQHSFRLFYSSCYLITRNLCCFIVPYDSTKPFIWSEYLAACGAKAVANIVFKQVCTISSRYLLMSNMTCSSSSSTSPTNSPYQLLMVNGMLTLHCFG